MNIFYCRVSTTHQNTSRQEELAERLGVEKENIYIDKASGKNTDRKALKEMLAFVRKGDTVYCESISRIARNTKDLLCIVEELQKKQVEFVSMKEDIDTSKPSGKFMLTLFAALAELERECILEKQAEGIAIAKAEGKYKGIVNYERLKDYRDFGGIRLEDDLVVTESGCKVIGDKQIPITVEDVEAIVGKA